MGKTNKRRGRKQDGGQVAEEIRTIRRILGLRIDDVAEVAGVSHALVGHIEHGRRSAATEGGDKIARAIQLLAAPSDGPRPTAADGHERWLKRRRQNGSE